MEPYTSAILGTLFLIINCVVKGLLTDIDVFPYYDSSVIADEDFFFHITEHVMNIQKCSFKLKDEDNIVLYNGREIVGNDTYRYWKSNSGNCGVWVKALKKVQSGYWSLIAQNSSGTYVGTLLVKVIDKTIPVNDDNVMILGDSAVINLGPSEVAYCKMYHPSGRSLGIKFEKCRHYLNFVRNIDAGQWTANYTIHGSLDESTVTSTYSIEGISESGVIGRFSKSLTEENALNIMCQLTNVQGSIDTCLFERPDGKGFLYNEGIGKGRYRSYKFGSRSDSTCGLTIINPVEEDFGIWKCEMGLKNGLKSQDGAFIYIKKNENESFPSIELSTFQSEVVAVAGSDVMLGCYIRYGLSSCWFRHPKGKIFNVEPESNNNYFKYSGSSLSLGQCSITLKNVTIDDVGEWWCNAALKNESLKDHSIPIAVYIEDQEIFAPLPEVKSYVSGSATLECYSTDSYQPLSFCRFIHPKGKGFTLNDKYSVHGKYKYAGKGLDAGDCSLQINPVEEDDFGTWICSTSLVNNRTKEAQAHINLKKIDTPGSSVAVITVTSVVVSGLVVALVFVFVRLRNRRRHFSNVSDR